MAEKRKTFLKNSPFKFFFSLFMSFIIFFSASLSASAAVTNLAIGVECPQVTCNLDLVSFNDSHFSRATYSGNLNFRASLSPAGRFAYGRIAVPFTVTWTHYSGISFSRPNLSLIYSSLLDGMSVDLVAYGDGNSMNGYLYFTFDGLEASTYLDFGLTFHFSAQASYSGGVSDPAITLFQNSVLCTMAFNTSNVTGDVTVFNNFYDNNPFYTWMYNAVNNINTGLTTLNNTVTARANEIKAKQDTINTSINTQGKNITDKIQTQINNDNSNTTKTINALNANSKSEVDAANKNSQNEINTANKNADDIMHSFDSGSQEDKNSQFDSSQKELQETEDNLFGSASGYFSGLDFSLFDIAKFNSVVSSLSFVSGLMQSLYTKMGDFGLIVTVGMVIMIASKVIGVYRFSTGDHGKGG